MDALLITIVTNDHHLRERIVLNFKLKSRKKYHIYDSSVSSSIFHSFLRHISSLLPPSISFYSYQCHSIEMDRLTEPEDKRKHEN